MKATDFFYSRPFNERQEIPKLTRPDEIDQLWQDLRAAIDRMNAEMIEHVGGSWSPAHFVRRAA